MFASCMLIIFLVNICIGCPPVEDCPDESPTTYDCSGYSQDDLDEWKSNYETMISLGELFGYSQAASNLQHFLDGSGNIVEMDKDFLLDYSAVEDRIEKNIEIIICGTTNAGSGIIGRGRKLNDGDSIREEICYCASGYAGWGTDLYYASGGFTIQTKADVCITRNDDKISFTMSDITHIYYDKYDWEAAKGLTAFVPGFGNVPDSAAYCLEQAAMGKSFIMKTEWKDDENTISGVIDATSADCNYDKSDDVDACKSPPILFVVDTTGSMSNDIAAVQSIIQILINNRKDTDSEPRLYVLSEFNDPSIGPVTTDTDADSFLASVNSLSATGGGDCPEYAMSGILNAIPYGDENSYMFFFTDADAKDEEKQAAVFAQLQAAQIAFIPFISGSCTRRRQLLESGNDLYVRLAFESGGFPIFTTHSGVIDVISIINSLTLSDTATLFIMVKENPMRPINITLPIDTDLNKVIFIVSSDSGSFPFVNVVSSPSNDIDYNVSLETQSLFSFNLFTNKNDSYGDYTMYIDTNTNIQFVDFISLTVVTQTSLSFEFYLSTDISLTGVSSQLFQGLSNSQSLRITASPNDASFVQSVDSINIISIDGESIIYNTNITFGVDGYYVIFDSNEYKNLINDSFRILVIGTDINGFKYYRTMNQEIILRELRLDISNIDTNIVIGSSIDIKFQVNVSDNITQSSQNILLSATSNLEEYVTLFVNPDSVSIIDSISAVLTISVDDDSDLIGQDLIITLTAINTDAGDYAYSQFEFAIMSNINDTDPPQCISLNNTYDNACSSLLDCNLSVWTAVIYVYDDNNGNNDNNYGIEWVTAISQDANSFTTILERNDNEMYLLFTSSCCYTYAEFLVYDIVNQISKCELKVNDQCEYDDIFGYGSLNETVIIQCNDIANNITKGINLSGGELSRKCMINGQWEGIINGECFAIDDVSTSQMPTTTQTKSKKKNKKQKRKRKRKRNRKKRDGKNCDDD